MRFRGICVRSAALLSLCIALGNGGCRRSDRTGADTSEPAAPSPVAAETASVAAVEPEPTVSTVNGAEVYTAHCATCHMGDGKGVPNFQPPIYGSPILDEDPIRLETVIRAGSAALTDRPNPMGWEMPPFGYLTNPEIKALVVYLRTEFRETE